MIKVFFGLDVNGRRRHIFLKIAPCLKFLTIAFEAQGDPNYQNKDYSRVFHKENLIAKMRKNMRKVEFGVEDN